MKKLNQTFSLAVLAIFATTACAAPDGSTTDPSVKADKKQEGDPQKVAIEFRSPGKPRAALALTHSLNGQVSPGGSGVLTVTIEDAYDSGNVVLTASSTQGLQLSANSSQATFAMGGNSNHVWDIFFDASAGGVHYIDIRAVVNGAPGASTFSYSAPIKVGSGPSAAKPSNPNMVTTPDGKTIIMMDAEETIIE